MLSKHKNILSRNNMIKKIDNYCNGFWKPNKKNEIAFLSSTLLKKITGNNKSMNTGKLSEWYVSELLKNKGLSFKTQPIIHYNLSMTENVKTDNTIGVLTRSKYKCLQKSNSKLINSFSTCATISSKAISLKSGLTIWIISTFSN